MTTPKNKAQFPVSVISVIAIYTDRNQHSEALSEIAFHLGEMFIYKKIYELIKAHHDVGYMTEDLLAERNTYKTHLLSRVNDIYANANEVLEAL